MFLVRVMLFMMSRMAGPVEAASGAEASVNATSDHRVSPRIKATSPVRGDMGYSPVDADAEGGVTREEMVKLFGNALRVR
ncbi:hypothetical protein [Sulfitobacter sp.]|uniref:hypothetical protein n=1 Tax=Sulfitobacter sp. TaxID=1903071 RepID=UPI003EF26252